MSLATINPLLPTPYIFGQSWNEAGSLIPQQLQRLCQTPLAPATVFFHWALSGDLLKCYQEESEKGRMLQIGTPERIVSS